MSTACGGRLVHLAGELDWGDGDYARTALTLEPVAAVVLDAAGVTAGDRVLDVAWRQMPEQRWVALRDESVALLGDANGDPRAFRSTSRYLVITALR